MSKSSTEYLSLTLDKLLSLSNEVRVEVFDNQIVQMPIIGALHHIIAGNIFRILRNYTDENRNWDYIPSWFDVSHELESQSN